VIEVARDPEANCPICNVATSDVVVELAFRSTRNLPDKVSIFSCRHCDFVFCWPRDRSGYEKYYTEVENDFVHTVSKFRNEDQLLRISGFIESLGLTRVMDFGCGGGGLAAALAIRHPDVEFVGYDVNGSLPPGGGNVSFTQAWPAGPFDLVILSHVLEHSSNPGAIIEELNSKYAPKNIYIEVPNPENYRYVDQPQYLYYVDRLHINHFGLKSLTKITKYHYKLLEYGNYQMPYDLGPLYPCQYALFGSVLDSVRNVEAAIGAYLNAQNRQAVDTKYILKDKKFYVYGFGDNFFRSRSGGGPLSGLDENIIGIIDRNIDQYRGLVPDGWEKIHPDDIGMLDGQLIVCAVTQSSDLDEFFKINCPDNDLIYI
jgi:SAM-dependent methyltransferase